MNKHDEARKILNIFRSKYYNDIGCDENKVVAQALNEIFPYLLTVELKLEQLEKDVKRYFYLGKKDLFPFNNKEHQEWAVLHEKLLKVGNQNEQT